MRRPPADRDQGDLEVGVTALELRVQREGALHSEFHVGVNLGGNSIRFKKNGKTLSRVTFFSPAED